MALPAWQGHRVAFSGVCVRNLGVVTLLFSVVLMLASFGTEFGFIQISLATASMISAIVAVVSVAEAPLPSVSTAAIVKNMQKGLRTLSEAKNT